MIGVYNDTFNRTHISNILKKLQILILCKKHGEMPEQKHEQKVWTKPS